jgi:hypothetical protein
MKSIFTLILLALFLSPLPAQELDSLRDIMDRKQSPVSADENDKGVNIKMGDKDLLRVNDHDDSTTISLGKNKILEVVDQPDSTHIRVGNQEISIVEKNDKSDIHIGKVKDHRNRNLNRFRGHWAGFEWGLNNLLDKDLTLSREGDAAFMDLNTNRSWCINLNFAQYSLGLGTSHLGLLTGIGLQYNNYYFDNANSLAEVDDYIVPVPLDESSLIRSKLTTSFLRIPLVLEGQFPRTVRSKRLFISAGLITGIKVGSHSKVVTKGSAGKKKDKNNDDFNLNPFRYGFIGRLGYGDISIYGEYFVTPLFVEGKGTELYPFSLGLSFSF